MIELVEKLYNLQLLFNQFESAIEIQMSKQYNLPQINHIVISHSLTMFFLLHSLVQFQLVCFSYVLHLPHHAVCLVQPILVAEKVLLCVAQVLDPEADLDGLSNLGCRLVVLIDEAAAHLVVQSVGSQAKLRNRVHSAALAAKSGTSVATRVDDVVACGAVMLDLEDASEQPSVVFRMREASLERADAVLEGDGRPAIHDRRPVLVDVDDALGHVTVQLEILIETEGQAWLAKCILPGHSLDGRLELLRGLLLELVLCECSLLTLAIVRGVESVLGLLVVSRRWTVVFIACVFDLLMAQWCHILGLPHGLIARTWCNLLRRRVGRDRLHALGEILVLAGVGAASARHGHEVLVQVMALLVAVLVPRSDRGSRCHRRHLELLGGALREDLVAMLCEERLRPANAMAYRIGGVFVGLVPAQRALSLGRAPVAQREHLLQVQLEGLEAGHGGACALVLLERTATERVLPRMQLALASRRKVLRVSRPTRLVRLEELERRRILFLQLLPGATGRRCQHLRRDGPDVLICLQFAVAWLDAVRIVDLRDDVENAQVTVFLSCMVHLLFSEDGEKLALRHLISLDRRALKLGAGWRGEVRVEELPVFIRFFCSCRLRSGSVLDEGRGDGHVTIAHLVVEEATDVTLTQRVKQGACRGFLTGNRNGQSELVYQLVLANLADVKAEFSDTFVDIIVTCQCAILSHSNLIELSRVRRNLGFAFYREKRDENFGRIERLMPLRPLSRVAVATDWKDEELGEVRVRHVLESLGVAASARILHLHHTPALREPRLTCIPQPFDLPNLEDEPLWDRLVPTRLALQVQILQHRQILPMQLAFHLLELLVGAVRPLPIRCRCVSNAHTVLSRRDSAWLLPIIEDLVAGLLALFMMPLGRGDVLPPPLSLLNVLLDALKFILESGEELRVTVVEEFAILVFRQVFFNFGLLIGQASAFHSHTKIN